MLSRLFGDEISRRVGYAGNPLDRRSEQRGDATWFAGQCARPDARFLLFSDDRVIVADGAPATAVLPPATAARFGIASEPVLLGFHAADATGPATDPAPWFAASVAATPEAIEADGGHTLYDLRGVVLAAAVPGPEAGALAQARSLLLWHQNHRFCARCGTETTMAEAGYRRDCPSCGAQHFPRTDPVAIMMVTDGDRCLLGRQPRFVAGMYSCLAGFIEPGETIEDAVRREVLEEAGIRVGRVAYHASQPWPFPSSLMIGMIGEALTTEIHRDETELEDCRWFGRDEVADMLAERHRDGLTAPKPIAIAHHLMQAFLTL